MLKELARQLAGLLFFVFILTYLFLFVVSSKLAVDVYKNAREAVRSTKDVLKFFFLVSLPIQFLASLLMMLTGGLVWALIPVPGLLSVIVTHK